MSEIYSEEDLINELPPELGDDNEFKRRVMVLDNFVVIEYSKRQLFIRHIHPNVFSQDIIKENLLFDVVAQNLHQAVEKMKMKTDNFKKDK